MTADPAGRLIIRERPLRVKDRPLSYEPVSGADEDGDGEAQSGGADEPAELREPGGNDGEETRQQQLHRGEDQTPNSPLRVNLANVLDTEKLANLVRPDDHELYDIDNCQICYASMHGLTPYEARDERLWAYMTHTFMLQYARTRWPIPTDTVTAVAHVRTHFFAKDQRQIERNNAASRLWWMAHLCDRVRGLQLSDSLRAFLYRTDVRASIIERPTVSQNLNVFSAIIRKLQESYSSHRRLFERTTFRRLMQEINSIGGVQVLDTMTEAQIADIIDGRDTEIRACNRRF